MSLIALQPDTVTHIPLDLVEPDPDQPREDFNVERLNNLATDIKNRGVRQPITVRPNPDMPGMFFIVMGERRHRASRLADRETIPCLLYQDEATDTLEKLLDQVKENHLREDLNPMEWANFFHVLNKQHKLKHGEIETLLKKHGIDNMGRSYISNIVRLRDLPAWASDRIRSGIMTPAHGKHILPAMISDKVMAKLEEKFAEGWDPNTRDLQDEIFRLFDHQHQSLRDWMVEFKPKETCGSCQKKRKLSMSWGRDETFCLDKTCWTKNNNAAKAAAEAKAKARAERPHDGDDDVVAIVSIDDLKAATNDKGQVNLEELDADFDAHEYMHRAEFDTSDCQTCPHHLPSIYDEYEDDEDADLTCFRPPCFETKQKAARIDDGLMRGFINHQLASAIQASDTMMLRLVYWAASGQPDGINHDDRRKTENLIMDRFPTRFSGKDNQEALLFKHQLLSLDTFLDLDDQDRLDHYTRDLAALLLGDLDAAQLVKLTERLDVSIDDYRIDQDWIDQHDEAELLAVINPDDKLFVDLENAKADGKVDKFALQNSEAIGIPAGIRSAWNRMTQKAKEVMEELQEEAEAEEQ